MAAYEKLAELAYRLYKKTIKGEIEWEVTVSPGVYQASFSDYSIKISLVQGEHLEAPEDVKINVIGDDGSIIESFTDVDIQASWLRAYGDAPGKYQMMYATYETARRTALGAEQAISHILAELSED